MLKKPTITKRLARWAQRIANHFDSNHRENDSDLAFKEVCQIV